MTNKTVFNPPRPTVTDDMILAAAELVATQMDIDDGADDIVDVYRHPMDGYRLAKKLDSYHGWDLRRDDIDMLDEMESHVRSALHNAQKEWVTTHNIQPPYPIGTRITCTVRNRVGVIDEIAGDHSPAAYLVKPDREGDEKSNSCRWVIRFEDVALLDEAAA